MIPAATRRNQPSLLQQIEDTRPRPYGARSDDAVLVGELLTQHVPELASGELEIAAIARRAGELTKVAVRGRLRLQPTTARPVPLVLGRAGERVHAVRMALPRPERVDIVQWHADPLLYITAALGLSYLPSSVLYPVRRRADILLGEIDYPAARGRRAVNMLLASALTSWQVRVKPIARSTSWQALQTAHQDELRTVSAAVTDKAPKGLRVLVCGLNGLLPFGQIRGVKRNTPPAVVASKIQHRLHQELQVSVLRLDADRGTIIVSERASAGRQPRLPML